MSFQLLTEQELAERLRLSTDTLQRYRKEGLLQQGVHWQRFRGGEVRYVEEIVLDWVANLEDPVAHQRAIEVWRSQLLSNRKRKRA